MLLHKSLEADLAYYVDEMGISGPMFPSMRRANGRLLVSDKPLTPGAISHIILDVTKKTLGRAYSPHKLRHFFATATHEAGASIEDVQEALRDVYNNYSHYLALAREGRQWVKQYTHENLEKKYHSLFKPSTIILGERTEVTDAYFMTNSQELYIKYQKTLH